VAVPAGDAEEVPECAPEVGDCVRVQMIHPKVWGTTEAVTSNTAFEHHRIHINKGGYCSKHRHQTKWNGFVLVSGRLLIRVWRGESVDETVLEAGGYLEVAPGFYHQFEALTDCLAFELYWAEYTPDDIDRENEGGMRSG
jgi:mannose-6-phosphate isomerase-like protein (cupin superfamily)